MEKIDKNNFCIRLTEENREPVLKYLLDKHGMVNVGLFGRFYGVKNGGSYYLGAETMYDHDSPPPILTFDQFKQHILNEPKPKKLSTLVDEDLPIINELLPDYKAKYEALAKDLYWLDELTTSETPVWIVEEFNKLMEKHSIINK